MITQRPRDIRMRYEYEALVKLCEQGRSEVLGGGGRTGPYASLSTTNPTRKALELSGESPASNIQNFT